MLVVETIARIRRDHLVRGVPIKKITRDLRASKNTVRKAPQEAARVLSVDYRDNLYRATQGVTFGRRLECAPGPGQVMYKELTGDAGLSEDESHGKAPHIQYRIQAAGGAGVSRRGEPSRALPAPRRLA